VPYDSNADVPSHVPEAKKSQWREIWNSAYKRAKDKGLDDKAAEQSAFKQANSVALDSTSMTEVGTKNRLFTCEFQTLGEVLDPIKGVFKIPIAYTGTFVKDGDKFSITASDLESIVRNFKTKGTGTVNVDYEHASEIPELAKGGPVVASGWINNLSLEQGMDGKPLLMGVIEWTPQAKQLIETKQYRFFSPAIDWAATNKETGEPQGATLTSAALTNRPFLEKLPPLLMTEVPRLSTEETKMANENDTKKQNLAEKDGGSLRLRKVTDGTGEHYQVHAPGKGEGEDAFGELMGEIFPNDWKAMTAAPPADGDGQVPEDAMCAAVGEALGETGAITMVDVKKHYTAGKTLQMIEAGKEGYKLLSETANEKGWDERKALTLLAEGKVSPQQFAAFQGAKILVEGAVGEGKIHPLQRKAFMSIAINRPADFEDVLKDAKPYVILGEHGLSGISVEGGTHQMSEHDRLDAEVRSYMKDNKVSYTKALKAITKDPVRGQKLRDEAHTTRTM